MPANTDLPLLIVKLTPPGAKDPVDITSTVLAFEIQLLDVGSAKGVLTIDNHTCEAFDRFRKGSEVQVIWGYQGRTTSRKLFVTDLEGGPETLQVGCRDVLTLLDGVDESHRFERSTRSSVARKLLEPLARRFGYRLEIEDTKVVLPEVGVARKTRAEAIADFARKEHLLFCVDEDTIRLHSRKTDAAPAVEYRWFTSDRAVFIDFRVRSVEFMHSPKGKISLHGRSPLDKKRLSGSGTNETAKRVSLGVEMIDAQTGASHLVDNLGASPAGDLVRESGYATTATSEADCQRRAERAYLRRAQRAHEISITVVGDPAVVPGQVVSVTSIGQRFSGLWMVESATHRIDSSGFVVEAEGCRDALGSLRDGKKDPKVSGKVNDKPALRRAGENKTTVEQIERVDPTTGELRIGWRQR
jgi:phage protein D